MKSASDCSLQVIALVHSGLPDPGDHLTIMPPQSALCNAVFQMTSRVLPQGPLFVLDNHHSPKP